MPMAARCRARREPEREAVLQACFWRRNCGGFTYFRAGRLLIPAALGSAAGANS